MNQRLSLTMAALLLAASAAAVVPGGAGGSSPLISIQVPLYLTPVPADTLEFEIEVLLRNVVAEVPDVEAELVTPDGQVISNATLSGDDHVYSGYLYLPYTSPPGEYRVNVEANVLGQITRDWVNVKVHTMAAYKMSKDVVKFGSGPPAAMLGPAGLTIHNQGNVPLKVSLEASGLEHAESLGDPIGAENIEVHHDGVSYGNLSQPLADLLPVPVAGTIDLDLFLQVPSGEVQYVAPGDYTGSITLEVEGEVPE